MIISGNQNICTANNQMQRQKNFSFTAKIIAPELGHSIENSLLKAKSADILCHIDPDYDTQKAALCMYDYFESKGIKPYLCIDKKNLLNLGIENGKDYRIKKRSKPSDISLILDHNGLDKISGPYKKLVKNAKNIFIIDHHPETEYTLPSAGSYIDTTAKSCCAILYRWFESIGRNLSESDAKNLLTGVGSDFQKSKRVDFAHTSTGSKLVRLERLETDKNSAEVLDKLESLLSKESKTKIYNNLDIMSNLTPEEQDFQKELFSKVKLTENGKLAYAVIDLKNKKYEDNPRTSAILRDLRLRLIGHPQDDKLFTQEQRDQFKKANVQGSVIFYPTQKTPDKPKSYQISMHSVSGTGYTKKWRDYSKEAYNKKEMERAGKVKYEFIGGGHVDRSGGRIYTYEKEPIKNFIESVLEAGQNVE